MIFPNETLPLDIQTPHGIEIISTASFIGKVVGYRSSQFNNVKSVVRNKSESLFRITYDDKRTGIYRESEWIYLNRRIIPFSSLLSYITSVSKIAGVKDIIKQLKEGLIIDYINPIQELSLEANKPVKYVPLLHGTIVPDPYAAGSIFPHCDLKLPYANIRSSKTRMLESILISMKLDVIPGDNVDYLYFTRKGDDKPIEWENFLSETVLKSFNDSIDDIPPIYQLNTIQHRWEFIRGYFDSAYEVTNNKQKQFSMEIRGSNLARLKLIANIIRSLGVLVRIDNVKLDPRLAHINTAHLSPEEFGSLKGNQNKFYIDQRPYVLQLIQRADDFYKFFNDVPLAERVTLWAQNLELLSPSSTYVTGIEYVGEAITYSLVTDDIDFIYCDSNFLPRVSI